MMMMMMIESRKRNSDQVERKLREYEDIICDDTLWCEPRRLEAAVHVMALSESVSRI
jgi:hypothetical protein